MYVVNSTVRVSSSQHCLQCTSLYYNVAQHCLQCTSLYYNVAQHCLQCTSLYYNVPQNRSIMISHLVPSSWSILCQHQDKL